MNASISSFDVVSTLFCVVLSVGAAGMAINLYSLLRTGQIGASWRVLIIASVLFALMQTVKMAEVLGVPYATSMHLSSVIELVFVLALAYAIYLQRQVFSESRHILRHEETGEIEEDGTPIVSAYERYS
jgi:predicted RND superfamily exporter protein